MLNDIPLLNMTRRYSLPFLIFHAKSQEFITYAMLKLSLSTFTLSVKLVFVCLYSFNIVRLSKKTISWQLLGLGAYIEQIKSHQSQIFPVVYPGLKSVLLIENHLSTECMPAPQDIS